MEQRLGNPLPRQSACARQGIVAGLVCFSLFFVLAWFLHYRGLSAPMYYDSYAWIEQKRHLFVTGPLSSIIDLFPQRPLTMLTFYGNYLVNDMNPVAFRLLNIALLSATAVVVGFLVNLLVSLVHGDRSRVIGLLAGLFFLVHPFQTYVTLYIWQRSALLACLFSYAALLTYLGVRTGGFRSPIAGYALCALLYAAAMLAKESAVALPAILLLAGIVFFRDTRKTVLVQAAVFSAVALICVGFLSFLERAHGNEAFSPGIVNTMTRYYEESELTLGQALLTQSRVIFQYISGVLFPTQATVQLVAPQVMSRSLLNPPITAVAAMGALGLVTAGVALLRKRPLFAFGILFFIINLLPESLLVPQYQFFGYRAILPMLGLILAATDLALAAVEAAASRRGRGVIASGVVGATLVLIAISGHLTREKADLWAEPTRFWADAVNRSSSDIEQREKRPLYQALYNLGSALQARGNYPEAIAPLAQALKLSPDRAAALTALAYSYEETDRLADAEQLLRNALALDPAYVRAYRVLGQLLVKEKRYAEANTVFQEALKLAPADDDLHDGLARLLLAEGKMEEGEAELRRALELNPRSFVSHSNLGAALLLRGKIDESVSHLQEALRIRPDYWSAHENLGAAMGVAGKPEQAVEHLRMAVQLNPLSASARQNLETALHHLSESRKGR